MDAALGAGHQRLRHRRRLWRRAQQTYIGASAEGEGRGGARPAAAQLEGLQPGRRGPNDRGLSRRQIVRQVEASLRRLGAEALDMYLIHEPDPTTPLDETLRALDDLVRQG